MPLHQHKGFASQHVPPVGIAKPVELVVSHSSW